MVKNRGVTLIESVIAILLLGILITAMVYSFASARMYAASARHRIQAINIARDEAEGIIQAGVEVNALSPHPSPGEDVSIDTSTGLTGKRIVTYNPSPVTGDTVDVTINVSWTERMWSDIPLSETIVVFLNTE